MPHEILCFVLIIMLKSIESTHDMPQSMIRYEPVSISFDRDYDKID